ncbi:Chlorophyll a-b binding protein 10A [Arachis hypogaea]|nr:Chlorophyll a-b binding protein 10A [Arachis hypogaea]
MAATTCCAVLNGLGSSFLCGGKRSYTLQAAPIGGKVGDVFAVSLTRLVVAAAAILHQRSHGSLLSKLVVISLTLNGLMSRKLAGDYGFDPLGLGKDPAFPQMVQTERLSSFMGGGQWLQFHGLWLVLVLFWGHNCFSWVGLRARDGWKIKDGDYIAHREKLERLKLAEIKHAKIAMLAMLHKRKHPLVP